MGVLITSIIAITIIICIVFKNVYIKKCENSYKMTEQFNKFYNMYFMLEKWLEGQYSDRCKVQPIHDIQACDCPRAS